MWNPITFRMLLGVGGLSVIGYCICKGDRNEQKRKQIRQNNAQKENHRNQICAISRKDTYKT